MVSSATRISTTCARHLTSSKTSSSKMVLNSCSMEEMRTVMLRESR